MNIQPREENSKTTIQKVLIVCEGEKTEPNYFRAFRVPSNVCKIEGTGHNTTSLVREATRLAKLDTYREVWCVFDKDSFTDSQVNRAHTNAYNKGFKVAFSNECFELWYLLHHQLIDTEINRKDYSKQLKKIHGKYEKNSPNMYDQLRDKQANAIKNAKKLSELHEPISSPAKCKPYTSVHKLVERLNKLAMQAK